MAFKTFTAGSVLTAADVNDYLMEQAVITCTSGTRPSSPNEGMTIYETDTDYIRVYDGATWQVIAGNTPAARAQRTTTQSIGTGSATAVSFGAADYNAGTMWAGGAPTRLTAPIGGVYTVTASVEFAANATGNRQVHIYQNGSERTRITVPSVGSGLATRVSHSDTLNMAASDYVECFVFQDSGGNLNITNGGDMPCLAATWIRRNV